MSAIHLVVRPSSEQTPATIWAPLYGLIDFVVDGVNITARLGEGQAFSLLAEVAHAVASLASCRRNRASVQLYADDQAWELGFESDAEDILVTVFRSGRCPEVVAYERRVALADLVNALLRALDEVPLSAAPRAAGAGLLNSRRALGVPRDIYGLAPRQRVDTSIAPRPVKSFGFAGRAELRRTRPLAASNEGAQPQLERADLHALLVLGQLSLSAHGRVAQLENIHLFLFAEQLLWIAEDVLDAWISERPLFRRVVCGGARLGVRRIDCDGALAVSLGSAEPQLSQEGRTFPEISPRTFVTAAVRFARELAKSIALHDPSQHRNLRLSALLHSAKALRVRLEECTAADSITNPEPENYRSFGIPARRERSSGPWSQGGKMRFLPRWVATVPDIDLSATFLCGELLLVGSARQLACLHRNSGAVLWRRPAPPAASVVTPAGLVRIQSDGTVRMHELASGETQFATYLAPRPGRGPSGALVHAPGLPKLLVLAEGERSVTAIDLVSGDVRWRYTARRPAGYRLRRAGKLMIVSGGDSALMALDVVTGEVVWRLRDRLPFSGDSVVDRDAVYAIAGGPVGPAKLHHIDVWSGNCVWSRDLGERPMPGQAPLLTPHFVVTITRDRRGVGVSALDRQTGEPAWEHEPGLASATTAWLAIDDALLANSASGTLLCLDSATGRFRYSHVFARHIDADQPRRFEPVLRGGALFIPQHQVHVVRPRDGEILGTVPSDLIPDLLRVDERCDVYIAEQSGHLAAFGAAPRLTLVK